MCCLAGTAIATASHPHARLPWQRTRRSATTRLCILLHDSANRAQSQHESTNEQVGCVEGEYADEAYHTDDAAVDYDDDVNADAMRMMMISMWVMRVACGG